MVHYQYISPRLNKNVLRVNPELICLQVSGLQDCVEVSLDSMVALGFNFVIELAMKLFITLVKHRSAEGFVFVVNDKWTVIVQGLPSICVKWDLYLNDEMLLL